MPTTVMRTKSLLPNARSNPLVRFYLLLSWIFISYYVIRMDLFTSQSALKKAHSGSSSQDVSELLLKQINNLNACPLVKLRGFARSNTKARRLNRFEAMLYWNIFYSVQTLSFLVAFIGDKLLRAGDVELNPGPTPPSTPVRVEMSEDSTSNVNRDQLDNSSELLPHGQMLPLQPATSASPNMHRIDRRANEPCISPPTESPIGELQTFPVEKGETQSASIDSPLVGPPPPTFPKQVASLVDTKGHLDEVKENKEDSGMQSQETSANSIQSLTSLEGPVQLTMKGGEQDYIAVASHSIFGTSQLQSAKHRRSLPSKMHTQPNQRKNPQVFQQQADVLELRQKLSNMEQLEQMGEAPTRLLKFFCAANKLYRSGEKCQVCPICLKLKVDHGGQRKSHAIPRNILEWYGKIHNPYKKTAYILDLSRNEVLAPGSLTYQLLCGNCEEYYSVMEQSLSSVYLQIAAKPNVDSIIEHNDSQAASWLRYILANILFRGILTNIDLNGRFQYEIYSLWKLCSGTLEATSEKICPDLKIFLLPNKPFNESLYDFMYPFEMLLRMPRCTELIETKTGGMFFYTKFDCFHIVFPLCKLSKDYFDTFNNGVREEGPNIFLRQAVLQKAEVSRQRKSISFEYPSNCAHLKDYFPAVLVQWCASLYETVVSTLYNHPQTLEPFLCIVERYTGASYIGFDIEERMKLNKVLKSTEFVDQRASLTTAYKDHCQLSKPVREKCVSRAQKNSPLRKQEVDMLTVELKNMNAELVATKKELGNTRKELGDTRQSLEREKEASSRQKETTERVRFDLLSSRAELQESRDQLDMERSQRWQLQQINDAHIASDRQQLDTIKFLYRTTLRHNRDQEQATRHRLKELISRSAAKYEDLMQLTQGADVKLHQTCKVIYEEYNSLLKLSPPPSPISPPPSPISPPIFEL